jgi:hypothetical protein
MVPLKVLGNLFHNLPTKRLFWGFKLKNKMHIHRQTSELLTPHKISIVVTSINLMSENMKKLSDMSVECGGGGMFMIADQKSTIPWSHPNIKYVSIEDQLTGKFSELAMLLPKNHYSRKNIGYLLAVGSNAEWVYETDDDNFPKEGILWNDQKFRQSRQVELNKTGWANPYQEFLPTNSEGNTVKIWPRGLPLEAIKGTDFESTDMTKSVGEISYTPLISGLVDGDPDVDAIYRLTASLPINFLEDNLVVTLGKHTFAPFNSQNTFWHSSLIPLMYLPVTTAFRVTDILRSYVCLAILQAKNETISFISSNAVQIRNEHNLIHDFKDELLLYTDSDRIMKSLKEVVTEHLSYEENLIACYIKLNQMGIVEDTEILVLDAWLKACDHVKKQISSTPDLTRSTKPKQ